MPTYLVRHVTAYRYRSAVAFGDHRMMFRPRESHDQRSRGFRLEITPTPTDVRWAEDASGNLVGTARFGQRARELTFAATIEVDQIPLRVDELSIADHARRLPFSYGAEEARDLSRFVERQHPDPEHVLDRWARACSRKPAPATPGRSCAG
jgi:transglutaminase-like putative cysteine protease